MDKELNIKEINGRNVLENAMEWINKNPSEIGRALNEENNLLSCIQIFNVLTMRIRFKNVETGIKFEEKRMEILLKFINIIFGTISKEIAIRIIEKWYKEVSKGDRYDDVALLFDQLPSEKISEDIKFMFFQIDDRFIIGGFDLIQTFCENKISQGIKEEYIQNLENINHAKIVILLENRELLIYTLKNRIERKIGFDKIIDCDYKEERIFETSFTRNILTIRTEDFAFPKLVISSWDEDISKLYKEIINNINNNDNISNYNIEDRLKKLKKLLELDLITELEYNEKKKQILLEL